MSLRGKLAAFPGQWVSAESVETMLAARTKEAKPPNIFIVRAPQPGRLRSLWACGSTWSLWAGYQFLCVAQEIILADYGFIMEIKSFVFRFDDVEVREREFSLTKAGKVLTVGPKAFRALLFLLHNPQRLISKEELLNSVWGDAAVTEGSLTRCIWLLRSVLGDDIRSPRYIETVATVGYRFIGKVEVSEEPSGEPEAAEQPNDLSGAGKKVGSRDQSWGWALVGGVLALCLAGVIWYLHRPLPPPRVTGH